MLIKKSLIFIMFILCGTIVSAQDIIKHTVKQGETLNGIAIEYSVKLDSLLKWNNIKIIEGKNSKGAIIKKENPAIQVGQELVVGKKEVVSQNGKNINIVDQSDVVKDSTQGSSNKLFARNKKNDVKPTLEKNTKRERKKKTDKENTQEEKSTSKNKKSSSWWWFWLFIGLGGGVYCWEKWLREKYLPLIYKKETKNNQVYIEELRADKLELKNKNKKLENKIKDLEKANRDLIADKLELGRIIKKQKNEIEDLVEQNIALGEDNADLKQSRIAKIPKLQNTIEHIHNENGIVIENNSSKLIDNKNTILYAEAIVGGYFNRVKEKPDTNTVFELHLKNSKMSDFIVYHNAYELVVQRPEFLDGAIEPGVGLDLDNLIAGTAQLEVDGKWKIMNKLNVSVS